MPVACKYCVLMNGIKGESNSGLFVTDEDLYKHLERAHGIIVRREGETEAEAAVRYSQTYGVRHNPRLEFEITSDLDEVGEPRERFFIMDRQAEYCVLELSGPSARRLGPIVTMILDWMEVQADPSKEHRKALNIRRSKERARKSRRVPH